MIVKNMPELRTIIANKIKKVVPHLIRSDTSLIMQVEEKPIELD